MKPNQPKPHSRVKALSAVIGGSAIVAMGALTAAVSEEHGSGTIVSDPGTFTSPSTSEMTTGETIVMDTTDLTTTPEVAAPPVTAEPPDGF